MPYFFFFRVACIYFINTYHICLFANNIQNMNKWLSVKKKRKKDYPCLFSSNNISSTQFSLKVLRLIEIHSVQFWSSHL